MIARLAQSTLAQPVAGATTDVVSFTTPDPGVTAMSASAAGAVGGSPGSIRITGSISVATTVNLRINEVNNKIDLGANTVADAIFSYAIPVPANTAMTIRFGAACTVNWLIVDWAPI